MKKWIIGIILLAVVAGGAFYVFQILPQAKKVSALETLVPDDALFYIYSYRPGKKIEEFQASSFFGKLSRTDIYKTIAEPQLNRLYQNAPFLTDLLEEEVAVAFLTIGNPEPGGFKYRDIGDFLVLVRFNPKKQAQIKRQILDAYLSVAGKGKTTYKTHKGIKVSKYTSVKPAFTMNYAFIADVLLLSNNANVLQNSINLYQNTGKAGLSENGSFQNIKSRVTKGAWAWGYQNNEAYNRQLFAYHASQALRSKSGRWAAYAVDPSQLNPIMELMNIIKVSGFSVERDILKDGFLWKGYYVLGEAKSKAISEIIKFISDSKILEADVFSVIPRDILAYVGVCKDISSLWRFAKYSFSQMSDFALSHTPYGGPAGGANAAKTKKQIREGLAKLDSVLGLSIENDIIPALGDDFGFVVVDLENTQIDMFNPQTGAPAQGMGGFSIVLPRMYAYLEVKDAPKITAVLGAAAEKLVEKANQQIMEKQRRWKETIEQQAPASSEQQEDLSPREEAPPLKLSKENYKGTEISNIEILNFPLASVMPNYCFLDKYLIFSHSLPLTKKVIDAYSSKGDSFARNPSFSSVKTKIPAEFSSVSFFDIRRSIEQLRSENFFNSIVYQMLSGAGRQGITKDKLDEFLDILSDLVSIISTNRVAEPNIIENYLYIKIKGL